MWMFKRAPNVDCRQFSPATILYCSTIKVLLCKYEQGLSVQSVLGMKWSGSPDREAVFV